MKSSLDVVLINLGAALLSILRQHYATEPKDSGCAPNSKPVDAMLAGRLLPRSSISLPIPTMAAMALCCTSTYFFLCTAAAAVVAAARDAAMVSRKHKPFSQSHHYLFVCVLCGEMHGRKKRDTPLSADELGALSAKAANYNKVLTAATRLRRELQDAPAPAREPFLALVAQVIRVNPDYYSMWNYRKEAAVLVLGDTIQDLSVADAADSKQGSPDAKQTAALNAAIAYATPQSSSATSATASSSVSAADAAQSAPAAAAPAAAGAEQQPSLTAAQTVQRELAITVEAFKRNPKSYSAWHHRRWVLSRGAAAVGGLEAYKRELE
eukprot:5357-Heterococcus_DN1.PRE.1